VLLIDHGGSLLSTNSVRIYQHPAESALAFKAFAGMGLEESARLERTVRLPRGQAFTKNGFGKENKMNTVKLRRPILLAVAAFAAFVLGACTQAVENKPAPNTIPSPTATSSPTATNSPEVANPGEAAVQKLIGRWDGPEGAFISVTEKKGADGKQQNPRKFTVEIKNLDKAETFEGTAKAGVIEFTRKGKTETVKAATGSETGMKGFEKETTCVVVTKGSEGFCKKAEAAPIASPEKK
jgi:hypothetical protein